MSNKSAPPNPNALAFWSLSPLDLLAQIKATPLGFTQAEAQSRLAGSVGMANPHPLWKMVVLLLAQFRSPIILILIFAALLSVFLKDTVDAGIILAIVLVSGLLGFWQERGA